jgi:hypothetical protein
VESFNGRLRDECLNEHLFPRSLQRDGSSKRGGRITTPFVPTAASAAWRPPSLPTAHATGILKPKLTYQRPENGEQVMGHKNARRQTFRNFSS